MLTLRSRLTVLTVAVLALLATLALPAVANHDPDPPYVASSQPGGYPLYGFHHDQLSTTIHAWTGIQRRPSDGFYRLWIKVQGDGRVMSVEYKDLSFFDHGYATYGACQVNFCYKGPGAVIYYTGTWHPVGEEVSIKALWVKATYRGGASTPGECLASYRMAAGGKFVIANPVC